ncbi:hypothetical protein P7C70_g7680, partial [Phenoliferia sp. Uapishka_3]
SPIPTSHQRENSNFSQSSRDESRMRAKRSASPPPEQKHKRRRVSEAEGNSPEHQSPVALTSRATLESTIGYLALYKEHHPSTSRHCAPLAASQSFSSTQPQPHTQYNQFESQQSTASQQTKKKKEPIERKRERPPKRVEGRRQSARRHVYFSLPWEDQGPKLARVSLSGSQGKLSDRQLLHMIGASDGQSLKSVVEHVHRITGFELHRIELRLPLDAASRPEEELTYTLDDEKEEGARGKTLVNWKVCLDDTIDVYISTSS